MANLLVLLENLVKAIKAEARNGCTNAGALGGFAEFVRQAVTKISSMPEAGKTRYKVILHRLGELARNYLELPSRQRQKSLEEIAKLVEELRRGIGTGPSHLTLAATIPFPKVYPIPENLADKKDTGLNKTANIKEKPAKESLAGKTTTGGSENSKDPAKGTAVQYLKNVGPKRAKLLAKLGVVTLEDLLNYFPKRYEDRRNVKSINQVIHGEVETIKGKVVGHQELKPRRGLTIIKIALSDGSGTLNAVWFNNPYLLKQLPLGIEIVVTGKVDRRFGGPDLAVSDYEIVDERELSLGIVPVYGATENLPSKQIRSLTRQALQRVEELMPEILPDSMLARYKFLRRAEAYRQIHFPDGFNQVEEARRRLVFEEFLLLQLGIQAIRGERNKLTGIPMDSNGELITRFRKSLSFQLTKAQQRVIGEILADMAGEQPMARLVQGDVGSGKTVVAAVALLRAVECGYQGAMMAPTEILAEQHYLYLHQVFCHLGVRVGLLTGSLAKKEKEEILEQVESGSMDILVGTHALIQEGVVFRALGLAVTDEQHRFGVRQRAVLQQKGNNPHVLVMTATPIPRSLALTIYGDLTLSVIDELPPGRKEIKTIHITDKSREKLHLFMEKEISAGRQVYVVCPLVEESEVLDLRAATEIADSLAQRFPKLRVGLLHGRMKTKEKEKVIEEFRLNQVQILVSTTVIEVGINVPNASVMVVEGAERFGLAQLHQLRGRVGRAGYQSYCMLISNAVNEEIKQRLGIMCQSNDGFRIAEEDLKLRGPGEFFGTRQHGLPELKIANIVQDGAVLEEARNALEKLTFQEKQSLFCEAEKRFGSQRLVRS